MSYIKLYQYVHCPFCVRIRMVAGFLEVPFESTVLDYNDENTPIELMGVKMLPIVEYPDGEKSNESLEIILRLDKENQLRTKNIVSNIASLDLLISRIGIEVHSLAMPYWMWTPEFNDESRAYFQQKKEAKRGSFKDLIKNKALFIKNLNSILNEEILLHLEPFYKSETMTLQDILLASHLWGMYTVPEFQFNDKIHYYLQTIGEQTKFDYHRDFWN